jgi:hypothetical protein
MRDKIDGWLTVAAIASLLLALLSHPLVSIILAIFALGLVIRRCWKKKGGS